MAIKFQEPITAADVPALIGKVQRECTILKRRKRCNFWLLNVGGLLIAASIVALVFFYFCLDDGFKTEALKRLPWLEPAIVFCTDMIKVFYGFLESFLNNIDKVPGSLSSLIDSLLSDLPEIVRSLSVLIMIPVNIVYYPAVFCLILAIFLLSHGAVVLLPGVVAASLLRFVFHKTITSANNRELANEGPAEKDKLKEELDRLDTTVQLYATQSLGSFGIAIFWTIVMLAGLAWLGYKSFLFTSLYSEFLSSIGGIIELVVTAAIVVVVCVFAIFVASSSLTPRFLFEEKEYTPFFEAVATSLDVKTKRQVEMEEQAKLEAKKRAEEEKHNRKVQAWAAQKKLEGYTYHYDSNGQYVFGPSPDTEKSSNDETIDDVMWDIVRNNLGDDFYKDV